MYTLKIENPSKLYFTSDTHFNHFNIARLCNRPYSSREEMNKALIDNWNSVVPEDGIVIHCGDFTLIHKINLKEYEKLANKLNGRILLIRGNHDRVPLIVENNPESKFIAIVDIAEIHIDNIKITASHYPLLAYPTNYAVNGHVHTLSDGLCHGMDEDVPARLRKTQYDVGVDQNNYTPISWNKLKEKLCLKSINV